MSSLRPIIVIVLLTLVGLYSFMKINETEPVIPEDAMEWDLSADIEIGGAVEQQSPASEYEIQITEGPTPSAAPASSGYEPAPAFTATTISEPAPTFDGGSTAPSFQSGGQHEDAMAIQLDSEETAATESDHAAAVRSPDLPPLPSLPQPAKHVEAPVDAGSTTTTPAPTATTSDAVAATTGSTAHASPTSAASQSSPNVAQPTQVAEEAQATKSAEKKAPGNSLGLGDRYSSAAVSAPAFTDDTPVTPTEEFSPQAEPSANQPSLFSATRMTVQAALDRGELSQALLLLSDWYGDPSLSADEAAEVQELLSQLAGSVIYSTEPRLEPPYIVQPGERLQDIAQKHNVPWQLLAKINGIDDPEKLQPGQQLKVLRGPFSARIDLGQRKLILMLDRRYAGQFSLEVDPTISVEEGYWTVSQKLLTPGSSHPAAAMSETPQEDRSIVLTSTTPGVTQVAVLRTASANPVVGDDASRVLKLNTADAEDLYDILSLGSQVVIRR